jgi:hypothetical protein
MGEYIPQAPLNDEARKHNQNLPGMGGVFNTVNLHTYHYAGNNPVKYIDPDGREDDIPPYRTGVDLNLFSPEGVGEIMGKDGYIAATRIKRPVTGAFVVAGHGDTTSVIDNREGKFKSLSPEDLAKEIKNHPNYHEGDTVILLACFVGKDDERLGTSFAQRLADKLGPGAIVKASDEYVHLFYSGAVASGPNYPDIQSYFDIRLKQLHPINNYCHLKTFEYRRPRERRR